VTTLEDMSATRPVSRPGRIGSLIPVQVDGFAGPVHVRVDGPADGRPLVLLHGFSGSMHWFDLVVPLLNDAFRQIRVDLLGHGSTGGPAADAPVQARAIEAVLAELDVRGATAIGHSFGADVAVELAETSDRIDRLVIVAQAPDYSDATLPRGNAVMTVPGLSTVLHRGAHAVGFAVNAAINTARRNRPGRELAARALLDFRALRVAMFRVVLIERRDRMAARPLDAQVRDAGKPTLVILGERDHFYGARSAGRYEAAGARVEIFSDCGHSPLVERPERTAQVIREFAR
jgi:pimeloyl-ACP methyl ester carboxylesterase